MWNNSISGPNPEGMPCKPQFSRPPWPNTCITSLASHVFRVHFTWERDWLTDLLTQLNSLFFLISQAMSVIYYFYSSLESELTLSTLLEWKYVTTQRVAAARQSSDAGFTWITSISLQNFTPLSMWLFSPPLHATSFRGQCGGANSIYTNLFLA